MNDKYTDEQFLKAQRWARATILAPTRPAIIDAMLSGVSSFAIIAFFCIFAGINLDAHLLSVLIVSAIVAAIFWAENNRRQRAYDQALADALEDIQTHTDD